MYFVQWQFNTKYYKPVTVQHNPYSIQISEGELDT